jgi:hypothetical protein
MSRKKQRLGTWGTALLAILLFGGISSAVTQVITGEGQSPTVTPSASASVSESPTPSPTTTDTSSPEPTETPTPEPTEPGGQVVSDKSTALGLLATLKVASWADDSAYDRDRFGDAWEDVDDNGCDTRNDILRRDFETISSEDGCLVLRGTIDDPYTGVTINFVRGSGTSTKVQIDHMVALSNAWRTGAQKLSWQLRVAFANDPLNLMAVDGPTNSAKSDSDAAEWLPPQTAYRCRYVARQISVKAEYHLWVTPSEKAAMIDVLDNCPTQKAYRTDYPERAVAGDLDIPAAASSSGGSGSGSSDGSSGGSSGSSGSGYVYPAGATPWANCTEARAAGAAPVLRGTPGYAPRLDRDGDGVGCE